MMRPILTAALIGVLASVTSAQSPFRINEVITLPTSGDQLVELINTAGTAQDVFGVNLCLQFVYFALPPQVVPAGGTITVHIGAVGTNTATDLFTGGGFPLMNPTQDGFSLYRPGGGFGFFDNAINIIDFIQWGAGSQPRVDVAVAAGIWPSLGAFNPAPALGESLAWDGAGDTTADWFRDIGPTPGAPNLSATAGWVSLGPGCGAVSAPTFVVNSVPALGNRDFSMFIDSDNASSGALLLFTVGTGSAPLFGGFCTLYVSLSSPPFQVLLFTNPSGDILLPATIPEEPLLVGLTLGLQVLIDNGVAFPEFDLSEGVGLTF